MFVNRNSIIMNNSNVRENNNKSEVMDGNKKYASANCVQCASTTKYNANMPRRNSTDTICSYFKKRRRSLSIGGNGNDHNETKIPLETTENIVEKTVNAVGEKRRKLINTIDNVLRDMQSSRQIVNVDNNWDNCVFTNNRITFKPSERARKVVTKFDNANSKKKFSMIYVILEKIRFLLANDAVANKRQIYYEHSDLIYDPLLVYKSIEYISCLLNVGQWELGIHSTTTGLIYGEMKMYLANESNPINCKNQGGVLVPNRIDVIQNFETDAEFILLIEKDCVFQKLIEENLAEKILKPFIMVTGKGYPSMSTRLFIRKLYTTLNIPILALVDGDPHGIDIMLTYRFGSATAAHLSDHLAVPEIKWLGIFPSEIYLLDIAKQNMTLNETNKIKSMLSRPYIEPNPKIKQELGIMLKRGFKCEIEGLLKNKLTYISDVYLPNKVLANDYI